MDGIGEGPASTSGDMTLEVVSADESPEHVVELQVATVPEIADLLRVAPKTVYAMIDRGELPGVRRVGRTIRISRSAVLRWLTEGQGRVSRSQRKR